WCPSFTRSTLYPPSRTAVQLDLVAEVIPHKPGWMGGHRESRSYLAFLWHPAELRQPLGARRSDRPAFVSEALTDVGHRARARRGELLVDRSPRGADDAIVRCIACRIRDPSHSLRSIRIPDMLSLFLWHPAEVRQLL